MMSVRLDTDSEDAASNKKMINAGEKSYRHPDDYHPSNHKKRRSEVAPIMIQKKDDLIHSKQIQNEQCAEFMESKKDDL